MPPGGGGSGRHAAASCYVGRRARRLGCADECLGRSEMNSPWHTWLIDPIIGVIDPIGLLAIRAPVAIAVGPALRSDPCEDKRS